MVCLLSTCLHNHALMLTSRINKVLYILASLHFYSVASDHLRCLFTSRVLLFQFTVCMRQMLFVQVVPSLIYLQSPPSIGCVTFKLRFVVLLTILINIHEGCPAGVVKSKTRLCTVLNTVSKSGQVAAGHKLESEAGKWTNNNNANPTSLSISWPAVTYLSNSDPRSIVCPVSLSALWPAVTCLSP